MRILATSLRLSAALLTIAALGVRTGWAQARTVEPVLSFPESGLDDPAAYQGYQTRFFRDAKGNVVQVYLDARSGRVVNLLADAVNESVGFTVRDASGKPLRLEWGTQSPRVSLAGGQRTIEYQLVADAPRISIGWILLGSMRVERDLQYSRRHLQPFGAPTFRLPEQEELIDNLKRLGAGEQQHELRLLGTTSVSELQKRLEPTLTRLSANSGRVRVTQSSLDEKTHLALELAVNPADAAIDEVAPQGVTIHSLKSGPITLTIGVTTDAPSLTALSREQIFTPEFLRFLADARSASGPSTDARYRRLEREARSVELLSSKEKLMAGLPNYATYFGRDMMMTALMMQPIWSEAMSEHVIASVLRKLGPEGDVSHEEALGGQAIRENSAEYNAHMKEYFRLRGSSKPAADTALANARAILVNLQKVRENYHMRDDEFQLPVLVGLYLSNPAVPPARKLAFLADSSDGGGARVIRLLHELSLVSKLAAPYARDPIVTNLVGSPRLDSTHWRSVSWRDSGAGYANGRFAMDINAIWVPRALEAIRDILIALPPLGFSESLKQSAMEEIAGTPLAQLVRDSTLLRRWINNWNGAARHFVVTRSPDEIRSAVQGKLGSLPADERAYWQGVLTATGADRQPIEFLALSLDADGHPIPVVNSDPATWILLRSRADTTSAARDRVLRDVRAFMRAYPVGLFVEGLGPLVANDTYASPEVWKAFDQDRYHSPHVVWGREVNLFMLGLAREITSSSAGERASYVSELRDALRRTRDAVEASGLKQTELWSYEINGGQLHPVRFGIATDIQLWNVTDLAVQFVLSKLETH
jgi:hypothetical protein